MNQIYKGLSYKQRALECVGVKKKKRMLVHLYTAYLECLIITVPR